MQREASRSRNPFSLDYWRSRDFSRLKPLLDRLAPLQPVLEVAVNLYHYVLRPRPRRLVLRPYSNLRTWQRRVFGLAIFPAVFVFCFVWGFFFALTAPYLIVPCLLPVVVLGLLAIWALPDERVAPLRLMRFLHAGFVISLILWPNYLAIALPGLPWMTFLRIFGIPLAIALLISLSASENFRNRMGEILNTVPFVWKALALFVVMTFVTLPFSKSITSSLNKTLIYHINWTAIFISSAYMFYKRGRVVRYIVLICALAVPIAALSFMEFQAQHLLWDSHVPSFLKVDDLDHLLKPEFRPGTGEYRAKVMFSTALGLAEYMAILTPFFLHWLVTGKTILLRVVSAAMLGVLFLSIDFSGSRLGYVGMLLSVLLYTLFWAYSRWRTQRSDLLAPAIFFSYPAFFVLVMAASLFVKKIHNAIWGGGAQASSTAARGEQIHMALPHMFENPIGHGTGMSGPAMGYGEGSFVTIDNYMISLGLDYGFLGLGAYYALFLGTAAFALRAAVFDAPHSRDPEAGYLAPLAVSVVAWMVIKLVFSQTDTDPLLWMEAGMTVALYARIQKEKQAALAGPFGGAANAR